MMAGKSVLITGCSEGGIGDAVAREFHRRGLTVFATARNASKMASLKELGIETIEMDVTRQDSINKAVQTVREAAGGRLDLLYNNAGVQHIMPFADCSVDDFRRVLDTNVLSVFAVTHAFLPLLIEAQGLVAIMASISDIWNAPFQTAYNASKAAVLAFGNTLRVELAPFGVRVVTIRTGSVSSHLFTNTTERCKVPEGSLYYPLKDSIERRDILDGVKWTPAEDFARQVASDLLGKRPSPVLWRASLASVARWVNFIGWPGMLDSAYLKKTGLGSLGPTKEKRA